jgi:hypothetical protein
VTIKTVRDTTQRKQSTLVQSALAVLLERQGGEMTYTQAEYAAIRAARGEYAIGSQVERSDSGEPVIRVKLVPSGAKGSMAKG